MTIYGYYLDPSKRTVSIMDPGLAAPCVVCGKALAVTDTGQFLTGDIDLGLRVAFYRVHEDCSKLADKEWTDNVVASAIELDMLALMQVQTMKLSN